MRGKLRAGRDRNRGSGITPADAGKTRLLITPTDLDRDHPRGCGENVIFSPFPFIFIGSPPRMRGKLGDIGGGNIKNRITPADAGKTSLRSPHRWLP